MRGVIHRFVNTAAGRLLWINIALVLAAKFVVPWAGSGLADISTALIALDPAQVVALTNQERAALGVGVLSWDTRLGAAAQAKLDDMNARGYFAHLSPDDRQPWDFIRSAGYSYQSAGENLGKGFKDAAVLVDAWMGSPLHRSNIVNPAYRNIGVAIGPVSVDGRTSMVVVQMFAAPYAGTASAKPVTRTPSTKPAIASAPVPTQQPLTTDTKVAGAQLTEVTVPSVRAGLDAGRTAGGAVGAYLAALLSLLTLAFIVTGVRRHAVLAWAGHAFALALLTALPSLELAMPAIF